MKAKTLRNAKAQVKKLAKLFDTLEQKLDGRKAYCEANRINPYHDITYTRLINKIHLNEIDHEAAEKRLATLTASYLKR